MAGVSYLRKQLHRYMSVERPKDFYANESMEEEAMDPLPMHVREDYIRELREYQDVVDQFRLSTTQAAATLAQSSAKRNSRQKRFLPRNAIVDVKTGKTPWTCPWYIHWVDMGSDTFPRFMRSVTCSTATCWFGRLTCRPKAFVVVILRRKRTRCWADDEQIEQLFPMREVRGESKLPPELKEEWVFEERAANFCCECILEAPEE
ncbi:protein trunk-like [Uloborus diversus]|uniref:protein trunk-like n=1 Tax=Uloborus diversus TaxID=327109 RepID=UPI002409227B|nr:protein trunk-like [Uloborus diversus]